MYESKRQLKLTREEASSGRWLPSQTRKAMGQPAGSGRSHSFGRIENECMAQWLRKRRRHANRASPYPQVRVLIVLGARSSKPCNPSGTFVVVLYGLACRWVAAGCPMRPERMQRAANAACDAGNSSCSLLAPGDRPGAFLFACAVGLRVLRRLKLLNSYSRDPVAFRREHGKFSSAVFDMFTCCRNMPEPPKYKSGQCLES